MDRITKLKFGKREIFLTLLGIVLYAGTSWVTNFANLSESEAAGVIRPGVAIPVFFGFAFGPIVGFLVGFLGNLSFDFINGFAFIPEDWSNLVGVASAFVLNWEFGNGLMGLIPGLFSMRYRNFSTAKDLVRAVLIIFVSVVIGMGVAGLLDPYVYPDYYVGVEDIFGSVWEFTWPIIITNFINAAVTVTILVYNYEYFEEAIAYAEKEGEKITLQTFTGSALVRRLLGTILISAAVPIIMLSIFLVQANMAGGELESGASLTLSTQLGFTITLTLVFIVSNAGLMAQSISQPLLRLSDKARVIEDGKLTVKEAKDLGKKVEGEDEVAQLSRIFYRMAQEVIQREQKLIRQVQKLKIEINEAKQKEEISEIVDTDFFKELQQKARKVKEERGK